MEATKYRKKQVVVEAMQFDGSISSARGIEEWSLHEAMVLHPSGRGSWELYVSTPSSWVAVPKGHWVVKQHDPRRPDDEFAYDCWPVDPDIFEQTYEVAEGRPSPAVHYAAEVIDEGEGWSISCGECGRTYRGVDLSFAVDSFAAHRVEAER